jgi:hypothetical protein
MNQYKRPNKRRRVLSDEGWKKFQDAICQTFGEAYMDKPPFQKLSDRTQSSDKSPLDPDTVSRIWRREKAVYRSSLKRLFGAVGLTLNPSDHIPLCEDLNDEISRVDTRVIAKPHQELQEAIKPSAGTRSSTPGVNDYWWRNVVPQMTMSIKDSLLPKEIHAMRAAATIEHQRFLDSLLPKEIQAMRQCLHTLSR